MKIIKFNEASTCAEKKTEKTPNLPASAANCLTEPFEQIVKMLVSTLIGESLFDSIPKGVPIKFALDTLSVARAHTKNHRSRIMDKQTSARAPLVNWDERTPKTANNQQANIEFCVHNILT